MAHGGGSHAPYSPIYIHRKENDMTSEIIVALLGLAGTLTGSFLGVVAASKLTQYRLQQLEDKVSKHNSIIERTYILEGRMQEVQHDIKELKQFHRPG